jgi:hypothetical protein
VAVVARVMVRRLERGAMVVLVLVLVVWRPVCT